MRVLFCGGRSYGDKSRVSKTFDQIDVSFACTGAARGADTFCVKEAQKRDIPAVLFPANWKGENHDAGPIRNQRMLDEFTPDLVVAFPGSSGTFDMIVRSKAQGFLVERVSR